MEFAGKIALVTGTSGIGRASARRLAQGGAQVLALGIDPKVNAEFDALAKAESLPMATRLCDVSDDAQVAAAVADCIARHGRLDIIVNAAAIHPFGTVLTTDPVTLGPLHGRQRRLDLSDRPPRHPAHDPGGGAIVNISSVQGHNCQQNVAVYVATKGAIHALTRAMALDHADQTGAGQLDLPRFGPHPDPVARRPHLRRRRASAKRKPSPASARPTPSAGSANRKRWPNWSPTSPRTRRGSSPDRISASTAA